MKKLFIQKTLNENEQPTKNELIRTLILSEVDLLKTPLNQLLKMIKHKNLNTSVVYSEIHLRTMAILARDT